MQPSTSKYLIDQTHSTFSALNNIRRTRRSTPLCSCSSNKEYSESKEKEADRHWRASRRWIEKSSEAEISFWLEIFLHWHLLAVGSSKVTSVWLLREGGRGGFVNELAFHAYMMNRFPHPIMMVSERPQQHISNSGHCFVTIWLDWIVKQELVDLWTLCGGLG